MKGRRVEKVFFQADEACCGDKIGWGVGGEKVLPPYSRQWFVWV